MLDRLIDHMCWADRRTAAALATVPAPDADLLGRWAHLLGAEANWLARIAGTTPAVAIWPTLTLAESGAVMARNHEGYRALLAAGGLDRVVDYANSRGDTFRNPVAEILHHVTMHGMYHRGQVMQGVRAQGGAPEGTDFITYLREV